jgi:hypothetical protein
MSDTDIHARCDLDSRSAATSPVSSGVSTHESPSVAQDGQAARTPCRNEDTDDAQPPQRCEMNGVVFPGCQA